MLSSPQLQTIIGGAAVKAPMRIGVAGHRVEQVVGLFGIGRFIGQLTSVTFFGEIPVEQSGEDFVGEDRLHARTPDPTSRRREWAA